ncbi:uncharacterized protein DFL_003057 [Arthrobotrys flagrans]|uniref:Uncharacterized protein n=1 Tax=Arthrobotrys flagrans TaxID=97331 RepID=A0A437ACQ2_ARTFL|nr:hypothetical protein DFL_007009 [Arthrobotrys flagrans]RVD88891.1 hypothetical protein DFL_003057 [Arthrobotrys flagrans]
MAARVVDLEVDGGTVASPTVDKDHLFPRQETRFSSSLRQSPGVISDIVGPSPFSSDAERIRKAVAENRRGKGRKVAAGKLSESSYGINTDYPTKLDKPAVPPPFAVHWRQIFYIFLDVDGELVPFEAGDSNPIGHSFMLLFRQDSLVDLTNFWLRKNLRDTAVWKKQGLWEMKEPIDWVDDVYIESPVSFGVFKKTNPIPSHIQVPEGDTTEEDLAEVLKLYETKGTLFAVIVPVVRAKGLKPAQTKPKATATATIIEPRPVPTNKEASPEKDIQLNSESTTPKSSIRPPPREASVEIASAIDVIDLSSDKEPTHIPSKEETNIEKLQAMLMEYYGGNPPPEIKPLLQPQEALPIKKRKRMSEGIMTDAGVCNQVLTDTEEIEEIVSKNDNTEEENNSSRTVRRSTRPHKPVNLHYP